MECASCHASLAPDAAFCSKCGAASQGVSEENPQDYSISAGATPPGVWHWLLLLLLLGERVLALFAFQVDEALWLAARWERPFLWIWGLGLGLVAMAFVALRKRAGGWWAGISALFLAARACIPMVSESRRAEEQVYGAVFSLMVASATLTFAFLYEQSYWRKPTPTFGPGESE